MIQGYEYSIKDYINLERMMTAFFFDALMTPTPATFLELYLKNLRSQLFAADDKMNEIEKLAHQFLDAAMFGN